MSRLTTSPSQNTGIEIPISPTTMIRVSSGVPRKTAAARPMTMLTTTQISAAPSTSESVTGAASTICGITSAPRFTNEVRSRVTNSFFIISPYCTGSGLSRPKSLRTAAQRRLVGVPAGDPRRRIDARRGEEDQEHEHADREHHEHHRDEPAREEEQHQCATRSFARGSSASRTPSPSTFSASTVRAIAIPGASATAGRE